MSESKKWRVIEGFTGGEEKSILDDVSAIRSRIQDTINNIQYIRQLISLLIIVFLIIVIVIMFKTRT